MISVLKETSNVFALSANDGMRKVSNDTYEGSKKAVKYTAKKSVQAVKGTGKLISKAYMKATDKKDK